MRPPLHPLFVAIALLATPASVTAQDQSDANSDIMTVCPDGHRCMNGGNCTKAGGVDLETGLEKYECDCSGIAAAGISCEFAAEVYCVKGVGPTSTTSFCVNQGRYTTIVTPDKDGDYEHAGCQCPDDWEGAHCQYQRGTAPDEQNGRDDGGGSTVNIQRADDLSIRSNADGGGLSTGTIVGISIGAFVGTLCLACLVRRFVQKEDAPSVVVAEGEESQGEEPRGEEPQGEESQGGVSQEIS